MSVNLSFLNSSSVRIVIYAPNRYTSLFKPTIMRLKHLVRVQVLTYNFKNSELNTCLSERLIIHIPLPSSNIHSLLRIDVFKYRFKRFFLWSFYNNRGRGLWFWLIISRSAISNNSTIPTSFHNHATISLISSRSISLNSLNSTNKNFSNNTYMVCFS